MGWQSSTREALRGKKCPSGKIFSANREQLWFNFIHDKQSCINIYINFSCAAISRTFLGRKIVIDFGFDLPNTAAGSSRLEKNNESFLAKLGLFWICCQFISQVPFLTSFSDLTCSLYVSDSEHFCGYWEPVWCHDEDTDIRNCLVLILNLEWNGME